MKLFEEFKLYETLWDNLTEAKADTQKLIDFAGEDLTNRFLAIKNRLKAPENDLYYWIKNKTPDELEQAVSALENVKSITKTKKDIADKGAELVCETEDWKVYHITTFEASQQYGRDTKWCITGVDGSGDKYWNEYSSQGVQFYFLITKGPYNPRGRDSKFAIAIYPDRDEYEIYDQHDEQAMPHEILNFEDINIPGVDFESLEYMGDTDGLNPDYCEICNRLYSARRLRVIDKNNPVPEDPDWDPTDADLDDTIFVCDNCYEKIVQEIKQGNLLNNI
jgi:hypothetical protein